MTITPDDAQRLRHSLAFLIADAPQTAHIFYDHLFRLAPKTRGLFVRSMDRQGMKLVATLGTIVMHIENWSELEPQITQLGLRHLAYGVRPEHYAPTGEALIATVKDVMGEAYEPAVTAAWARAYAMVEKAMLETPAHRRVSAGPDGADPDETRLASDP
ncbi:globin domain-containing protein [Acuticoccus sp. I52.16.1]|uniref:globin domain-containing protein n=1 Tax=Acuticoccus sp. I52.16.1 TaxID=2928472 RepID=UPI001FD1E29D|nr:globin domain-containing protein [Acuticoccus sp. I52.16.1]UOM37265.1 globin domain-containing protein [Acuticoccus sp. I52.16.1]